MFLTALASDNPKFQALTRPLAASYQALNTLPLFPFRMSTSNPFP